MYILTCSSPGNNVQSLCNAGISEHGAPWTAFKLDESMMSDDISSWNAMHGGLLGLSSRPLRDPSLTCTLEQAHVMLQALSCLSGFRFDQALITLCLT